MKKSIIYLGLALIATANVSFASNVNSVSKTSDGVELEVEMTPLNIAICKGDIQTVKKLIEYGTDVNQASNGLTPLMYAARYNKVDIIKLLLAKGARLNVKNELGFTALKYAEISKANEAIQLLKQESL